MRSRASTRKTPKRQHQMRAGSGPRQRSAVRRSVPTQAAAVGRPCAPAASLAGRRGALQWAWWRVKGLRNGRRPGGRADRRPPKVSAPPCTRQRGGRLSPIVDGTSFEKNQHPPATYQCVAGMALGETTPGACPPLSGLRPSEAGAIPLFTASVTAVSVSSSKL